MDPSPTDLLSRGRVLAHVGSPVVPDSARAKIAREILSAASVVSVASRDRREELPDARSISQAVLLGREPRAIIAYFVVADCEWLTGIARRLYLPSIVRNPRAMFPQSRVVFEEARRYTQARRFEMAIAFGETNPLQYAVFFAHRTVATSIYRTLRLHARVPKKWSSVGGLPQEAQSDPTPTPL